MPESTVVQLEVVHVATAGVDMWDVTTASGERVRVTRRQLCGCPRPGDRLLCSPYAMIRAEARPLAPTPVGWPDARTRAAGDANRD